MALPTSLNQKEANLYNFIEQLAMGKDMKTCQSHRIIEMKASINHHYKLKCLLKEVSVQCITTVERKEEQRGVVCPLQQWQQNTNIEQPKIEEVVSLIPRSK